MVVAVNKDISNSITVSFPYTPHLVEKVKTIEGRKWHPQEKYWSFPNTDETLKKILEVFEGEELQIDPTLKFATSKVKEIPSLLAGEGDGYNFEDLRKELISRKYSYKTVKGYIYYNRDFLNFTGKDPSELMMKTLRTISFISRRINNQKHQH